MHVATDILPNHLLASLEMTGCEHLRSQLEMVPVELGDVLCESDSRVRDVFFPITSIVSLVYVMEDGATDEIAAVGNEGMVGVPLFMGDDTTGNRAVVRCAGYAFRLKGRFLLDEFNRTTAVQRLLLRYAQSLIAQISRTAACNRHHSLRQQLCRWLLSSVDRARSNELKITHEAIAGMLGVRRESITAEAAELQSAGSIRLERGRITILDRRKLEERACECYQEPKRESGTVLSARIPATTSQCRAQSRLPRLPGVGARPQMGIASMAVN